MTDDKPINSNSDLEAIKGQLVKEPKAKWRAATNKFVLAALGSIPWVGGFLSAAASFSGEQEETRADHLRTQWLLEHEAKMKDLGETIDEVLARFSSLGDQIDQRIQSEEYLALVRRAFRVWDRADTREKRKLVANLISNASGTNLCSDDVVRLFIDWLDQYDEAHFAVVREIYHKTESSLYDIWDSIHGEQVREDSAEADLFKRLVRDLSMGGIIRQPRDTNFAGQYLRKSKPKRRGTPSPTLSSAFDDSKTYVLTELGKQFVHYAMNEVVPRVGQAENE